MLAEASSDQDRQVPERDTRTDQELVAAANGGDPAAFEALYHRYKDWTLRLAYRFSGNRADALDVLQDTFTYLIEKFPGFRLTASMTTFLYPVVRHNALALLRKKRKHAAADVSALEIPAPPEPNPSQIADLTQIVSALPQSQGEVVFMRYVHGMSTVEIAAALRIPPGTVKSRLHNALRTLRNDRRTQRYFQE